MFSYSQAIHYLDSLINYEKIPDFAVHKRFLNLQRMRDLLDLLGDPHKSLKAIHITGTKGKGSTAAMIASILTSGDLKVGLYTSPHLISPRERIRIGKEMIGEERFAQLIFQIKIAVEKIKASLSPTFFEVYTCLAFLYFFLERVDIAVIEVGMGGRWDATNVINPLIGVVTQISLDHMKELGGNLLDITKEKAGIIKRKINIVSSPQNPSVLSLLEKICREREARIYKIGKEVTFESLSSGKEGQTFKVNGIKRFYPDLFIPLIGKHQIINASTAIAVVELIEEEGIFICRESIKQGLKKVYWPARVEILPQKPIFIVDCAHNRASAEALAQCLREIFPQKKIILILAILKNKDVEGIGKALCPLGDTIIVTKVNSPRALALDKLSAQIKKYCYSNPLIEKDISSAIAKATNLAEKEDIICITGSVYLAGEALNYFNITV